MALLLALGGMGRVLAAGAAAELGLAELGRAQGRPEVVARSLVVPAQVERWRREALALEHGDGVPRDEAAAAALYCLAARHGDAQAQFNLGWMLTNARGIERNDASAAHLFAAAAEQGHAQAANMARLLGRPRGALPPCLLAPQEDDPPVAAEAGAASTGAAAPAAAPPDSGAPAAIERFVALEAPRYGLDPALVLAVMAVESGFDPWAVSPAGARGLMQLIPATAARFAVRDLHDPAQNIRGGMAYLRWLLSSFEGDLVFTLAAYNAGERAVERYRGVPPYAETRAYVRRIQARLGWRRSHPFEPGVAPPSPLAEAVRRAMPR